MVCVVGIGVYVSAISGHVPLFFFFTGSKTFTLYSTYY